MKKIFISFVLLSAVGTLHSIAWEDVAPYTIGIPVGLTATGISQLVFSYARTTFLKNVDKMSIQAFSIFNTTSFVVAGIAAAYYIAQKTCKNECGQTPKHILEKTIDIAGLSSALGLMGYYVFKTCPHTQPCTLPTHCPYLSAKRKLMRFISAYKLPQVPDTPFALCTDIPYSL